MAIQQEFGPGGIAENLAKWLAQPITTSPHEYCIAALPESVSGVSQPELGSLIMPGSFNPLHVGHLEMARIAVARFARPCWFEISVDNVDKQRLAASQLEARLQQLFHPHGVVLTNTPTFEQKSTLFPETIFVVGADTIVRFCDLKYHNHDPQQLLSAIETIATNRCRFIVFGRMISNKFVDQQNIALVEQLLELCTFVNRQQFSMDVSSTGIRAENDTNSPDGS